MNRMLNKLGEKIHNINNNNKETNLGIIKFWFYENFPHGETLTFLIVD